MKKGCPYPELDKDLIEEVSSLSPLKPYEEKSFAFKLLGDYDAVYEGYSNDPELRYKASTGGMLSDIAAYLLDNTIVDGVIHTAVSASSQIGTQTVISKTRKEVIDRCGSRNSIS